MTAYLISLGIGFIIGFNLPGFIKFLKSDYFNNQT